MSNLYICSTKYQLLITLLKVKEEENNVLLTLFPLRQKEEEKLNASALFTKVMYEDEYDFVFLKPEKILKNIRFYQFVKGFTHCYLFLDHRIVGCFLNRFHLPYHLLEDGYDFFRFQRKQGRIFESRIFEWIYRVLCRPQAPGCGKFVLDIEVNNKKGLEKDRRYSKMVEVSRKELFSRATKERKAFLLDFFGCKEFAYERERKTALILTQPLWQDRFDEESCPTEEAQLRYYKEIVNRYRGEYHIYFKPHPRDGVDYSQIKEVAFLEKDTPLELYEVLGDYCFDLGITHSSSALDYLSCVKEKIFLKRLEKNYE